MKNKISSEKINQHLGSTHANVTEHQKQEQLFSKDEKRIRKKDGNES